MPRVRSVSNIKANLLRPALTSAFEVELGIPNDLRRQLGARTDKLQLMCSEAVLPGSELATTEMNNDFTGVTERHAYRRMFDDRIDLSFYVDAEDYVPIRFFEAWMSYIVNENSNDALNENYFYRMRYPDDYTSTGLKVTKFEKDHKQSLEYEFVKSYPIAITSMPVSYDASSLLKCNVSLTYIRYVVKPGGGFGAWSRPSVLDVFDPFSQSVFNSNALTNIGANFADAAVTRFTGNSFLGDVAGNVAGNLLGRLF